MYIYIPLRMNHDARRNYRSSNRWDAAVEILKTEFRLEQGREHERAHRQYTKRNHEYWFGGGIQEERRKRQRLQYHTPLIWLKLIVLWL